MHRMPERKAFMSMRLPANDIISSLQRITLDAYSAVKGTVSATGRSDGRKPKQFLLLEVNAQCGLSEMKIIRLWSYFAIFRKVIYTIDH
jgi:hypothetical protein